jgi:hypothetical protein
MNENDKKKDLIKLISRNPSVRNLQQLNKQNL